MKMLKNLVLVMVLCSLSVLVEPAFSGLDAAAASYFSSETLTLSDHAAEGGSDCRTESGSGGGTDPGSGGGDDFCDWSDCIKFSFFQKTNEQQRRNKKGMMEPRPNEDRYITPDSSDILSARFAFFAVCDGHGGNAVVDFVRDNLKKIVLSHLNDRPSLDYKDPGVGEIIKKILNDVFVEIDKSALSFSASEFATSGTTVVAALFDKETKKIYVANTGDSRAVLFDSEFTQYWATNDHKPHLDERWCGNLKESIDKRIIKESKGVLRMACSNGLALSRAIGDKNMKQENENIIPTPDITEHVVDSGDRLILATDGFWDAISCDELLEQASDQEILAKKSMEYLVGKASYDEKRQKPINDCDDITVMCVDF